MPHPDRTSQILLVSYDGETDHFAGVEAALAARGVGGDRGSDVARYTLRDAAEPFPGSARVVVVKDTRSYLSLFALRQARRCAAATVLVMDGIVEYRNTYLNPRAGPDFLRPAPVDVVACAGEVDRRMLEAFGNNAVATGLPRLAAAFPAPLSPATGPDSVLVATANQPYFCAHERPRLVRSLVRLRNALTSLGVPAVWRLTGGLDAEIGVSPPPGPPTSLREALAAAAAVITTPSTVMVEAMLAGRPTALLHPHPTPCWQPAVWVWRGGEIAEIDLAAGLDPASIAVGDAGELVRRMLAPCEAELARHEAAISRLHQSSKNRPAAEALADLIIQQLESPLRSRHPISLPTVERLPPRPPPTPRQGQTQVVACIRLDGTTVGELLSRVQRLAAAFAESSEDTSPGFKLHPLAIITQPDAWDPLASTLCADGRTHVCVVDPLADAWRIVETVRQAMERLEPAVVLAEADDLGLMAAEHLRERGDGKPGARVVPLVAGDGEAVRSLLSQFDRWDAAAALDASAQAWLNEKHTAAGREVALIPPALTAPAAPRAERPKGAALRLAYIGPMLEPGHNIHALHALLAALDKCGTPFELHMVGDGDHLIAWRAEAQRRAWRHGQFIIHGRRESAWVSELLATIDISLHPAEEGTGDGASVLEAMAHGAVPVVAHPPALAAPMFRDGHNAILGPLNNTSNTAARIAALADDPAQLAGMAAAARQSVRGLGDPATAARAAAALFSRLLARPADTTPSDRGLRVHPAGRWLRSWSEDSQGAEAWAHARLAAAGFDSIALDRPTPSCDAVIIRPHHHRPDPREIDRWRRRGLAVVASPSLRSDYSPLVLRLYTLLAAAVADGAHRIAIYGTGSHTRRARDLLDLGLPIVGFIDDAATGTSKLWGLPVVPPHAAASALNIDTVLLSSDAWEAQMWARCAPLRAAGIRVIPVYGRYGSSSDDPAAPPPPRLKPVRHSIGATTT